MKSIRSCFEGLSLLVLVLLILVVCPDDVRAEDPPMAEEFVSDGVVYTPTGYDTCAVSGISDSEMSVVDIPSSVEDGDGNTYTVTSVKSNAVYSENISELRLPETIETIETHAICCYSIRVLEIDAANPCFCSTDGCIYTKDMSTLVLVNPAVTGTLTLDDFVTNLYPGAFSYSGLTCIRNLPRMVVIPEGLFEYCVDLTVFEFRGCSGNTVPEGTLMIGTSAFMETAITEVHLPDSLKVIESGAFTYSGITSIQIPQNLYHLGDYVFLGCDQLVSITVDAGNGIYFSEGGVLFRKDVMEKTEVITLEHYPADRSQEEYGVPSNVSKIRPSAFFSTNHLKTVVLSDSLRVLDSYSFFRCVSLEKVVFKDSTLVIDEGAFEACENLSEVVMSGNLQWIMPYAFIECGSLTSLNLPGSLEYIGDYSFFGCGLEHIEFDEGLKTVGAFAFGDNRNLTRAEFNGTATLGAGAFDTGSKKIVLVTPRGMSVDKDVFGDTPYEVQHIGDRPFPVFNLFGIAVCVLILAGIVCLFRRI